MSSQDQENGVCQSGRLPGLTLLTEGAAQNRL